MRLVAGGIARRGRGARGDHAFHRLAEELDWLTLGAGGAARDGDG